MGKRILKELIKEQDITVGMFQLLIYPEITEYLALSDLDYVVLDLEHSAHTIEYAHSCLLAGAAYDLPMLVRVSEKEQYLIEQALDAGAQGVVVPTVETVEDCELIAKAARFAPEGERGYCNILPAKRWMNKWEGDTWNDDFDKDTYCKIANEQIFVAAIIETPLGRKNLPDMLKVPGIDCFMFGPGDFSLRMGKTSRDPEVVQIMEDTIRLVNESGKIGCANGGAANIEEICKKGYKMVQMGMNERMCIQERLRNEIGVMRTVASK